MKKIGNEIFQIISPGNCLEFSEEKDTVINNRDFKLTNISGNLPKIRHKKIYDFSITQLGSKRKKQMA